MRILRPFRSARGRGFTLIELIAVLVIFGLLAGTVTLSLRGPQRTLLMEDVLQQVAAQDERGRQHARRINQSMQLTFDLEAQHLQREAATSPESAGRVDVSGWSLPSGYRIAQLRLPEQPPVTSQVAIRFSSDGRSTTYAAEVAGPPPSQDARAAPPSRWIVFAGLSGQHWVLQDADELAAVFDALEQGT